MRDFNAVDEAQMLAEPYPLEWRGRELRLSLINQNVKAKFNAACKANAIAEFEELRELLTKDGKPDEVRIAAEWIPIRDGLVSGQYKWGGGQATAFLRTNPGERILLKTLLEEGGTPLTDAEIGQLRADKRAELLRLYEIIMLESEAPADPKAKRAPPTPVDAPPALQISTPRSSVIRTGSL